MNNTFNLQRFGYLVRRHLLEYGKIQLITLGIIFGIILAFYGYYFITALLNPIGMGDLGFRGPLFVVLGIIFISLAAAQHFASLGQKPKAIIELTLPASTFEKFLIGILFSFILAILSYLLVFYLVDLAVISKVHQKFQIVTKMRDGLGVVQISNGPSYFFSSNIFTNLPKPVVVLPMLLSSVFLLGSVYFVKFHYVKTLVSIMVFSGIWFAFLVSLSKALFEDAVAINGGKFIRQESLEWPAALLIVVLSLVFWGITYVRLREKEV